jgi:hypothetical protein
MHDDAGYGSYRKWKGGEKNSPSHKAACDMYSGVLLAITGYVELYQGRHRTRLDWPSSR